MTVFAILNIKKVPFIIYFASLIHLLFWVSFSPNTAMDANNYLRMMLNGESNLIHAPGYPYFFHFLIPYLTKLLNVVFESIELPLLYSLTFIQHTITLISYLFLYPVLKNLFSKVVASLSILLLCLNWTVLGFTNTIYPEWFQSKLLIFSFCTVYFAFQSSSFRKKIALYVFALFVFSISFLVKFNILILVFPLLTPIIYEKLSVGKKVFILGISLLAGFVFIFLFIISYHQPYTGTYSLTYDKAWILSEKLQWLFDGNTPPKDIGINTNKLLLLASVLPSVDSTQLYDFQTVNFAPTRVRGSYKDVYTKITGMKKNESQELVNRLPPLDSSKFYNTWASISYYVGLRESNELILKVFIESYKKNPISVAVKILKSSYYSIVNPYYYSIIPTELYRMTKKGENYSFYETHHTNCEFKTVTVNPEKYGFASLHLSCAFENTNFGNQYKNIVWVPGALLFNGLVKINNAVPPVFYIFLIIISLTKISNDFLNKQIPKGLFIIYAYLVFWILLFIIFSNSLFYFRFEKEYQQIAPSLSVLLSICISQFMPTVSQKRPING